MKRRPNPKEQGEVAELAFMHKAASLGFGVAKPYGDSRPYDFILDVGGRLWKVQVKSTYQQFQGGYFINAQRRLRWGTCPYKESDVELLVAYVAPENCWYVIPIGVIAPRKSLRLYPHRPEKDERYGRFREAWGLMEPGVKTPTADDAKDGRGEQRNHPRCSGPKATRTQPRSGVIR